MRELMYRWIELSARHDRWRAEDAERRSRGLRPLHDEWGMALLSQEVRTLGSELSDFLAQRYRGQARTRLSAVPGIDT